MHIWPVSLSIKLPDVGWKNDNNDVIAMYGSVQILNYLSSDPGGLIYSVFVHTCQPRMNNAGPL